MVKSTQKTEWGLVRVSDQAIAEAAALAASRCAGVAGLGQRGPAASLAGWLGGLSSDAHGVAVELAGRGVSLRVYLVVEFGSDMGECAQAVQEAVAEAVETMSGLEVRAVDVVIQGVRATGANRGKNA